MFTGLVQSLGKFSKSVQAEFGSKLYINSDFLLANVALGDSVSCNGVCLTVSEIGSDVVGFDVMTETLNLTNLGHLQDDSLVNLELAMLPSTRFGGHFVTGHIDFMTVLTEISQNKYLFKMDDMFKKYIAPKGSVTINGVSLTVVDSANDSFSVCLIPTTITDTNFVMLKPGMHVNIEIDLIARYLENLTRTYE
jgi:riboflavin synthase